LPATPHAFAQVSAMPVSQTQRLRQSLHPPQFGEVVHTPAEVLPPAPLSMVPPSELHPTRRKHTTRAIAAIADAVLFKAHLRQVRTTLAPLGNFEVGAARAVRLER